MGRGRFLIAWLVLASCAGDGQDGVDNLVTLTAEPPGENCADGGQRLDSGLDDGEPGGTPGDGVLQQGEIDVTSYVCNGDAGATMLTAVSVEPAGANCPYGGHLVSVGLDNGDGDGTAGNGVLEPGEVDESFYLCSGAEGREGDGGATALVLVEPEAPGGNCALGGQRISTGLDDGDGGGTADDGVLQAGEIDQTSYVCNAAGDALVSITAEPPGVNCVVGGQRIDVGADDGDGGGTAGDGILDPGEIDTSYYVCTTAQVGKYYLLPLELTLTDARAACDAAGMVLATWSDPVDDPLDMRAACDIGPKSSSGTYICFTQYTVVGGAPESIYDGSPMPALHAELWDVLGGPTVWPNGLDVVLNQDPQHFELANAVGYPLCKLAGS